MGNRLEHFTSYRSTRIAAHESYTPIKGFSDPTSEDIFREKKF